MQKIKPFISKCKLNYPLGKDDWKKFEKNNPTITLNVLLYVNRMNKNTAYKSKHN